MGKAKITISNDQAKKLKVAASYSDVKIIGMDKVGPSKAKVLVSFRDPAQLVEMGGYLETVTGDELDAPKTEAPKPSTPKK